MPELPEVESVVRQLRTAGLGGSEIRRARVYWARTIAPPGKAAFLRGLPGARVAGLRRRGKFIVLDLEVKTDFLIRHDALAGIQMALDLPPGLQMDLCIGLKCCFADLRRSLFAHDYQREWPLRVGKGEPARCVC